LIISVSRRTDIPAFYSEWFFNRLREGYVLVRNPMNFKQVSKISLKKGDVECFVFWTKNPKKFLDNIEELDRYQFYFQITINPYDKSIEVGVPKKKEIMSSFIDLSKKIGKDKVIWRYDPIILSDKIDIEYHVKYFDYIASTLSGYTNKCVISFLDIYPKTKRNTKELNLKDISEQDMITISEELVKIANKYNIEIETCSEKIDLDSLGINHGKCIDDKLISQLIGCDDSIDKDSNQREECGCVKSVDIGMYNTCPHQCKYCYANYSLETALKNHGLHDPQSPLLFGQLRGDEKITERKIIKHFTNYQLRLFD
jgi:DNA repair photolyase